SAQRRQPDRCSYHERVTTPRVNRLSVRPEVLRSTFRRTLFDVEVCSSIQLRSRSGVQNLSEGSMVAVGVAAIPLVNQSERIGARSCHATAGSPPSATQCWILSGQRDANLRALCPSGKTLTTTYGAGFHAIGERVDGADPLRAGRRERMVGQS